MTTNQIVSVTFVLVIGVSIGSPSVVLAQNLGMENTSIRQKAEQYRISAENHVRRNNLSAAMQNYQKILALQRLGQNDIDVLYNLGVLAVTRSQCKGAVLYFQAYLRAAISDDGRQDIEKKLQKCVRRLGHVENVTIHTVPSRTAVRVNDVFVGYSPVRDLKLPVHGVEIRVEHLDHHSLTTRFKVTANRPNSTTLRLTKKIYYGDLEVLVDPVRDVAVYLNKVRVGSPPYKRKRLPAGRYLLHLEKPGWDNWVRYITITRDEKLKVVVKMEDTNTDVPIPPLPSNDE